MLFSVIIPTYNRREFLARTLESVYAQSFSDYEIIVVDDGSTDGTAEWLEAEHNRVKVIRQENRGPGAARNAGARRATAEYLAFLDSDDLWFPWTLQTFAAVIATHNSPAILAGKLADSFQDDDLESIKCAPITIDTFPDFISSAQKGGFVGAGQLVLLSGSFLRCGGFDVERMNCEDHDLSLRLGTENSFIQITAPETVAWSRHSGSETSKTHLSITGAQRLIAKERSGHYPGGTSRAYERLTILTRHVRPIAIECIHSGRRTDGWRLYRQTFRWHVRLRRWKFLFGFPIKAAVRWG